MIVKKKIFDDVYNVYAANLMPNYNPQGRSNDFHRTGGGTCQHLMRKSRKFPPNNSVGFLDVTKQTFFAAVKYGKIIDKTLQPHMQTILSASAGHPSMTKGS